MSDHADPKNCPSYYDGCNCNDMWKGFKELEDRNQELFTRLERSTDLVEQSVVKVKEASKIIESQTAYVQKLEAALVWYADGVHVKKALADWWSDTAEEREGRN